MPTKRILVTGGAGFIGRNLIGRLIQDGYRVTSLDNYQIGGKEFLPDEIRGEVDWVEGDSRDGHLVMSLVRDTDAVIHLASPSSFLMYEEDPTGGASVTIQGFLNILEAMHRHDVEKLIYASTSAVYEGNPVPYVEGMTLQPPDLKALSKKWNEDAAHQYAARYGMTAVGLRPFSVYGHDEFSKGGYANVISLFVWAFLAGEVPVVWGDGNQTRDFIHVDDVTRAFQAALEADITTRELNLGTGLETTFNQVIEIIAEKLGVAPRRRFVDVPITIYAHRLLADTNLMEQTLGFRPEIHVREGIQRVIESAKAAYWRWPNLGEMQMYYQSISR